MNNISIEKTLYDRGREYGDFMLHAQITQDIYNKLLIHAVDEAIEELSVDQKEAIHMICHKLGRIVNGNPNSIDSWVDIAGYAKLIANRLTKEQAQNKEEDKRLVEE